MKLLGQFLTALSLTMLTGFAIGAEPAARMVYDGAPGGARILEAGQRPVVIHSTVDDMERFRQNIHAAKSGGRSGGNLNYHGGIGVETAPKIYLVLWGSQWTNNDPSGEAATLQNFLSSMGGSAWANTNTQYCQGVASGTVYCNGAGTAAGNTAGMLQGIWYDSASAAPRRPTQAQIGAEAVNAAAHFGNTAAGSNATTQYVIATATGNSSRGFGSSYCAYHSSTSSSYGDVAFTDLPYMTDAGSNCGANFNGLGPDAGITIVEGHEASETITDQFPNGGWLDSGGSEIGDKCAWISSGQGASADVTMPDGQTFPVQSLWSNAFNGGAGGCVLSY